jgi:4-diphosphocytidyl-2-C-methyl-D-erythritol kinase
MHPRGESHRGSSAQPLDVMRKLLRSSAPAKINLFLRVTGRRPDGYHDLDSVFLPVSLYDRVYVEVRHANESRVELFCASETGPAGERNLAFRAAREFMADFGIQAEALIKLRKEIPVGAGLGGGSSDAGAVLRMMAELCGVGRSPALEAVAIKLGADVPFFLNPAPSRVRGIGQRIEPLARMEKLSLVIAVPPIEVLTASVFRDLQPEHWSGAAPEEDIVAIVEGRIERHHLVNDLEQVAIAKWPEIRDLKELIGGLGASGVAMTGSGGAVFGIFRSDSQASDACQQIERRAPHVQAFTASAL